MIIDERAAQRFFPGQDPIGKQIDDPVTVGEPNQTGPPITIIGVVAHTPVNQLLYDGLLLLQHRGHNLMGAGRSIAVQNFNEQACILGLGAFYTGMTRYGLSAFMAIAIFWMLG